MTAPREELPTTQVPALLGGEQPLPPSGAEAPPPVDEEPTFEQRTSSARRKRGTAQPEAAVTRRIIDWINARPDGFARKVHQTAVTGGGEPDVDACIRGRAVKIEVKRPGAPAPPAAQLARLSRWQRAGALVGWATGIEHVEALVAHVDDRSWINPLTGPGDPGLTAPPG